MSRSLQDQLLKAGLVDPDKARSEKKAGHRKRKQRAKIKADAPAVEASRRQAEQSRRDKVERDRKINAERQRQRELKALRAQAREIVDQHRIDRADGDTPYQFADRGKIKKIYVLESMPGDLAAGRLSIVRLEGSYDVVPAAVAGRIAERDPRCVIVLNDGSNEKTTDDEAYADHPVPDDLMW